MKSTTNTSQIKTEFTLKNATSYAGGKVVLDFLEKIKLEAAFRQLDCTKGGNSIFPFWKILLYLVVGWLFGCQRLFHFRTLQNDSLIKRFLGGRCPHHSLLYKELGRLSAKGSSLKWQLRKLNQQVITPHLPESLILDFDSTVETVYGNQEGAEVGVNPSKPGRKSYHPLLVFEGQSRFCLNGILRPGNTHSSTHAIEFAKTTLELLPSGSNVKFARFDKGFGGEEFYRFWEQKRIGYVGKLKWTKRLQDAISSCNHWKRYVDEDIVIEGITLIYQATTWKKPRRVVIIRKAERYDLDQLQLYDFLWEYEAIVTNLDWSPIDVWRFYNQRACVENSIKEAKNGFSIHAIASSEFESNEVDMLIKLFTYNLFQRFKKDCCDPIHQGFTIQRFRQDFLRVAGILVSHSRTVILKIADSFSNRWILEQMMVRVAQLE